MSRHEDERAPEPRSRTARHLSSRRLRRNVQIIERTLAAGHGSTHSACRSSQSSALFAFAVRRLYPCLVRRAIFKPARPPAAEFEPAGACAAHNQRRTSGSRYSESPAEVVESDKPIPSFPAFASTTGRSAFMRLWPRPGHAGVAHNRGIAIPARPVPPSAESRIRPDPRRPRPPVRASLCRLNRRVPAMGRCRPSNVRRVPRRLMPPSAPAASAASRPAAACIRRPRTWSRPAPLHRLLRFLRPAPHHATQRGTRPRVHFAPTASQCGPGRADSRSPVAASRAGFHPHARRAHRASAARRASFGGSAAGAPDRAAAPRSGAASQTAADSPHARLRATAFAAARRAGTSLSRSRPAALSRTRSPRPADSCAVPASRRPAAPTSPANSCAVPLPGCADASHQPAARSSAAHAHRAAAPPSGQARHAPAASQA